MKRLVRPLTLKFKYSGYYFLCFIVLVLIGFWPTYFSKFFNGSADFTYYFHFHAITATSWVIVLITQPMLILSKKFQIHRMVGKLSYGLVPLLFISVLLLAHSRIDPYAEDLAYRVWIPFKDLFIFSFGYGVAILYRKSMPIHARGMIVAGMALIEPTMVRLVVNVIGIPQPIGYYIGISPDYIILVLLIVLERKEARGRWVFPCALGFFLFVHIVRIFKITFPIWNDFSHWFISLPLT